MVSSFSKYSASPNLSRKFAAIPVWEYVRIPGQNDELTFTDWMGEMLDGGETVFLPDPLGALVEGRNSDAELYGGEPILGKI